MEERSTDAALTKLLNIGKGEKLTYFNLQRYMKHHFLKAPSACITKKNKKNKNNVEI